MLIADAQIHAWADGEATGHHRRDAITSTVLDAEMAAAGVDRVLVVPPLWDPNGNAYALGMAKAEPERFAVMGLLQFKGWQSRDLTADAEHLLAQPGLKGVRFLFNEPDRIAPYRAGGFDSIWPFLEARNVVAALLIPNALDIAAELAGRYPGISFIVDHLGVPRGANGPSAFRHLPQLLALARYPNISVKAAGVGDYAAEDYPFPSLDAPLKQVIDAFGPERVVWASDLSRLQHPYRQCVTHFTEGLGWLGAEEKALIMGGNLCRLLDWPVAGQVAARA